MIRLIIGRGGKSSMEILVPEEWNELNRQQLTQLASLLTLEIANDVKANVSIAKILLSIDDKLFAAIDPGVLQENIFPLGEWVKGGNTLTEQLMPTLELDQANILYGPARGLGNLKLVEWDFAERLLDAWIKAPEEIELLSELAAVLYRPAQENYDFVRDPDGDARITFNENLIPYYSKLILANVPIGHLLAIMMFYRGCREQIIGDYKIVFSAGKNKKAKSDPGYFDLMRAIAKEGTYGDFDKVEQMYLVNALQELRCSKEEAEAIKMKSQNKDL